MYIKPYEVHQKPIKPNILAAWVQQGLPYHRVLARDGIWRKSDANCYQKWSLSLSHSNYKRILSKHCVLAWVKRQMSRCFVRLAPSSIFRAVSWSWLMRWLARLYRPIPLCRTNAWFLKSMKTKKIWDVSCHTRFQKIKPIVLFSRFCISINVPEKLRFAP